MRLSLLLLIILVVCLYVELATSARSLVYQKEMSEYCRRRVMPSVFLGMHVAEAHSKILHFSKMELPYSCFISVRGELGSNLILVAQLLSDSNLVSACDYYPNQLLVYEMGETFGGYWGPLPETLMRPTPTVQRRYVHKSTTMMSTQRTSIESTAKPTIATTETPMPTEPKQDYVQVEVPLLELTGQMDSGGNESPVFKIEDRFDMLFDVTPGTHEQYVTSELPMLQFSIGKSVDGRRFGTDTMFDFEYEDGLPTSDIKLPHLSLRTTTKKKSSIRKTYETIRSYTKQKPLFTVTRKPKTDKTLRLDNKKTSRTTEKTWEQIEELLKGLNESNLRNAEAVDESENITRILESISKLHHNYSVYLHPDWKSIDNIENFQRNTLNKYNFSLFTRKLFPHLTLATQNIHQLLKSTMFFNFTNIFSTKSTDFYDKNVTENVTQVTTEHSKKKVEDNYTQSISNDNNILNETTYTEQSSMNYNVTMPSISTQVQSEETTNYKTHDDSTNTSIVTLVPGTMVDHESWENVVQAAPEMAVLLNSTAQTNIEANATFPENFTTAMRKKRSILPIPIEDARPHELITSRGEFPTTESQMYYPSDMQDFAQLVELQDDELHDRVALRYLRQYVGPVLFNICDYTEPKARHIFLFNSSRIVIAISNFTLERMSVVLTPARTLVGSSSKCSDCRLECQVFGTRVCVDKINACDGVPNCGAFDIYDEDRLTCGAAEGLQHNVYLAAITFIAVLLTMLYTVHYWLRRCVPRVSEAFFIYTDRAENTLYLETIMRSPHDAGDNTNLYHHGNVFMTEETIYDELVLLNKVKRRIGYKMWRCCFAFITCKWRRGDNDLKLELGPNKGTTKTTYSFTELELKKMGTLGGVDVSVQTGDSLEIDIKNKNTPAKEQQPQHHIIDMPSTSSGTDSRKQSKELQILKLMKESKTHCKEPCKCTDSPDEASMAEKVIYTLDLHSSAHTDIKMPKPKKKPEVYSPRSKSSKPAVKHLRFDEEPVTIPTSDFEDEEELIQGLPVDGDRTHKKDHNAGKTEDELGTTVRRFWHTKNKKSRKKTNLALH